MVKRQMYGRAKLDLLRARLLGSGRHTEPHAWQESIEGIGQEVGHL